MEQITGNNTAQPKSCPFQWLTDWLTAQTVSLQVNGQCRGRRGNYFRPPSSCGMNDVSTELNFISLFGKVKAVQDRWKNDVKEIWACGQNFQFYLKLKWLHKRSISRPTYYCSLIAGLSAIILQPHGILLLLLPLLLLFQSAVYSDFIFANHKLSKKERQTVPPV